MVRGKLGLMAAALLGSSAGLRNSKKASCGQKGDLVSNKIVNGNEASPCEWSWQVGLRNEGGKQIWCGGMLVDAEWVATAAHCITTTTGDIDANFEIVAGAFNMYVSSGEEQVRGVRQVIRHPDYDSETLNNDYAMVRLETPIDLDETCVGTICLPNVDIAPKSKCWITGWGLLNDGGRQPDKLQEGMVSIISNDNCTKYFAYEKGVITDKMLCAQGIKDDENVVDACQGDSGGPLVCEINGQWTLHGATSWGYGCAGATYPGVWARIHAEVKWMQDTIDNPPVPPPPSPPPVRRQCPSFARYPEPDYDDECACKYGFICSTNGKDRNCPTVAGLGGWGGMWFTYTCSDCKCIKA